MRGISSIEIEPPLWEVDANLRPEGKQGALVRTLDSHLSYYDRWAKSWEFQALLKARPIAGDAALGEAYVNAVQPKIWTSAARENFVDSVQRMRERVTEHIPRDESAATSSSSGPAASAMSSSRSSCCSSCTGSRMTGSASAARSMRCDALVAEGYIGRAEAAAFSHDYRVLRLLEHRVQLRNLRRTHLMPSRPEELRVLARSSRLADTGERVWERVGVGQARGARHPRPPLLSTAAVGGRRASGRGAIALDRAGARPSRRDRLRRPGGSAAAHRGADDAG